MRFGGLDVRERYRYGSDSSCLDGMSRRCRRVEGRGGVREGGGLVHVRGTGCLDGVKVEAGFAGGGSVLGSTVTPWIGRLLAD